MIEKLSQHEYQMVLIASSLALSNYSKRCCVSYYDGLESDLHNTLHSKYMDTEIDFHWNIFLFVFVYWLSSLLLYLELYLCMLFMIADLKLTLGYHLDRDLGNSNLSGHLVPELGKLEYLQYLWVSCNTPTLFPIGRCTFSFIP